MGPVMGPFLEGAILMEFGQSKRLSLFQTGPEAKCIYHFLYCTRILLVPVVAFQAPTPGAVMSCDI